jgi:glycosyltransferase involved in cell wall biosynthesis
MTASGRPRRLLIISFSYAPMLHARAFRWTSLAGYFARSGWEVDVLTSWQPGSSDSRSGSLAIHRAGWRWAESMRRILRRGRGQLPPAGSGPERPGFGGRLLAGLRAALWRPFYWPDSSCFWYWPARRAALRLLREREHDAIVSVTPTFTGVVVGEATRRARPGARWLLDVGDPFSLQVEAAPNNARLYGALNRRVERRVFAAADAIAVTTPQTAARYAGSFPESAGKIRVIPPLFSVPSGPKAPAPFPQDGGIRFVYVGTLYKGLREPRFLLELFEDLVRQRAGERLELHLYGDVHQFAAQLEGWRGRLPGALHVHGAVPREVVAAAIDASSVLVNIGNRSEDQLPSKVVEYVASGRPILNIASGPHDLSTAFLGPYPDRLVLVDSGAAPGAADIAALARFAERLPRRLAEREVAPLLEAYQLPRIAAAYAELLA